MKKTPETFVQILICNIALFLSVRFKIVSFVHIII